ncbi:YiiD C-terminal domain-containing protein [Rhodococcus erythropolis]|uniref:YiiD C-terminal domain-containing protein n=1 Tax=Rhodococcus erythropolis TaxID=1833 RepID=UPI001E4142E9|nr:MULTISPECIES: YiiD C-terminal domain-containing protein [Rhodococcus erythropolis group]MCD2104572.1 DUF4442 domain-containing protein [Rhodococcus qingshengii]MCZ4525303.1 YiiD C-terminal domain-containing protein [Rhodococcus erythropolis]
MSTSTSTSTTGHRVGLFAAAFGDIDGGAPDYEHLRSVSNSLVPFGKHVGTIVTEIGPDRAVVEIPREPHVVNHMNTVHAGALFTAADIAGAAAFVGAAATRLYVVESLVVRSARSTYRKPASGNIRAIATVDEREMRAILAAQSDARFELTGKALMVNDDDVTVAKFTFDYVCDVVVSDGQV